MILPRKLIENVMYYHEMYERKTHTDVITVYWKQWWKIRTKYRFPRAIVAIADDGKTTFEATPGCIELLVQIHAKVNETFEDPDPEPTVTTKREGNVIQIERTET